MPETKVSGTDVVLQIDVANGTSYDLVVCLESQSLSRATNTIDAKSKCGPDTSAGTQEISIDFDGQVVAPPTGTLVGISLLHDLWAAKTTFTWKWGKLVPTAGDVTYTGSGFLSKLDETANMDENAKFSASIGVSGSITKTVTP